VDWDFWLRVARRRPVAWLARPTVSVRWHAASETHRFASGTTDLDEQIRLLSDLYARDSALWPDARWLRRAADRRLARAFLNRSHQALHIGDSGLARLCLNRGLALSPSILSTIARDPRLAVQMALLRLAPGVAGRLFTARVRS
jgi:hypothetical protein